MNETVDWLRSQCCEYVLTDVRRVLKPDGVLHLHQGIGLGWLIERVVSDEPDAEEIMEKIINGIRHSGRYCYFSRRSLERMLHEWGFYIDKSVIPFVEYSNKSKTGEMPAKDVEELVWRLKDKKFRKEISKERTAVDGVERYITFNAIKLK